MRIVALNIRHGGGPRILPIVEYLKSKDPDVVVVSEFRENSNAIVLRRAMLDCGLDSFAAATTKLRENSVGVFARSQFQAKTFPELGIKHTHRVIAAQFSSLTIYGVYFPQQQAKAEVFDFFLGGVPSVQSEPQLVVGDFNTGLHGIDEAGETFYCADKMLALTNQGFIDCWRSRNPEERVFTWYTTGGNGFRIDHAFATAAVNDRIKEIGYDHTPRETACTDHSALVIDVDS